MFFFCPHRRSQAYPPAKGKLTESSASRWAASTARIYLILPFLGNSCTILRWSIQRRENVGANAHGSHCRCAVPANGIRCGPCCLQSHHTWSDGAQEEALGVWVQSSYLFPIPYSGFAGVIFLPLYACHYSHLTIMASKFLIPSAHEGVVPLWIDLATIMTLPVTPGFNL